MAVTNPDQHMMRVRVRTRVFRRLQEIAKAESERLRETISASDLVRGALVDTINVYDTSNRLNGFANEKIVKS